MTTTDPYLDPRAGREWLVVVRSGPVAVVERFADRDEALDFMERLAPEAEDPTAPARGLWLGVAAGIAIWLVLIAIAYLVIR